MVFGCLVSSINRCPWPKDVTISWPHVRCRCLAKRGTCGSGFTTMWSVGSGRVVNLSLANKLPEHAARLAAVLALVGDVEAAEVGSGEMEAGIALAQHYAAEGLRLFGASRVSADLREAQQLLVWLRTKWPEPLISLPDRRR
jgi:hypothetical protein